MNLLKLVKTFRHGVHPAEEKEATRDLKIERMPFTSEYVLPLSQHAGKPAIAVVEVGAEVTRGQLIAKPDGFISTAIHAPVTGTVTAIEHRPHPAGTKREAIIIAIDPFSDQRVEGGPPPMEGDRDAVVAAIQGAGIVGMGGAGFPSHVKLAVPEGRKVRFAVLNGCECEPFLTCDHRQMAERPNDVVNGLRIIMRQTGAERGYIGIERNKPEAIEALNAATADDPSIEIVPLVVKYPQGAEKMLIDAIFKKEVPSGKLPLDLEIVVQNIGTAVALTELFEHGTPVVERVVTVSGPGVTRPANLIVPIGTSVEAVLAHCGGLRQGNRQVILGGPMMGRAQKRLDVPVLKGTSGILGFTKPVPVVDEEPCIRCGRCLTACPIFLNPSRLAFFVKQDRVEELDDHHMLDCYECASCSFVCPSHIPLVQLMSVGKSLVRENRARLE